MYEILTLEIDKVEKTKKISIKKINSLIMDDISSEFVQIKTPTSMTEIQKSFRLYR